MQKSLFLKVFTRFTIWGTLLGTLAGLLLFYFYSLAYYGIYGIIFHTLSGTVLGAINAVVFAVANYDASPDSQSKRRRITLLACGITSFISGIILYSLIYYPLARTLGSTLIISLLPTTVATLIAVYASQRTTLTT